MLNRFSLAKMIRSLFRMRRRKPVPFRPIPHDKKAAKAYTKALQGMVAEIAKITREEVVPAASKGPAEASAALEGMKRLAVSITPNTVNIVTGILKKAETTHQAAWIKSVHSATGIDIRPVITEGDLAEEFALVVKRNVSLVKDLSDDACNRVERVITQAVLNGTRAGDISKDLTEQFGIANRRAKLIARDQMAKATSDLTRLRQEQCGIKKYRWSTSLDERVRKTHKANEGRIFAWAVPPSVTGHPGHDVNCRCVAIAEIDLSDDD